MYNDKYLQSERRQAMQRRSISASARTDGNDSVPRVNDNPGGRRCDGTMPDQRPDQRPDQISDRRPDHKADRDMMGWGLREYPPAMVYSPYQIFREIYTPDTALSRGTLFSELDLPFEGYKNGG